MKLRVIFGDKGPVAQFLNDVGAVMYHGEVSEVHIQDVPVNMEDIKVDGQPYKLLTQKVEVAESGK